ncbi:conjugative transfer signal peptidase TraF [Salmonella enterica subsp. enterica serovar Schwarzengrund]|nr:conjugative transfer signal peptidase TraF [Salmonella enterica subsp. enterica serovar Schwarzengrund]
MSPYYDPKQFRGSKAAFKKSRQWDGGRKPAKALEKVVGVAAFTVVTALMLGAVCYAAGGRVNTTKSIPVGLYWTTSAAVEKGAYVLWCPPKAGVFDDAKERGYIGAGFCAGGYGYMMKRVLAAKNDTVTVTDDGVRVNGELLPLSKPIKADSAGRPLPRLKADRYTLGNSEVLLMSDVSATSFDGRYFGPIKLSQIKTVIRPVITW